MTRSDFKKLLQRYTQGECTAEEKISIQIWFDAITLKPNYTLTDFEKVITEKKLLADIEKRIYQEKNEKDDEKPFSGRLNSYLIYGSIAVSLILAIFMMRSEWKTTKNIISQQLEAIRYNENRIISRSKNTEKSQLITLQDSSIACRTHFDTGKR